MYLLQSLNQGFWASTLLTFGVRSFSVGGCCAVHWGMSSSVSGLRPPDTGTLPQSWQSVMSPDNTKGEIMPSGESLMDWLWNTRFQKQNKTKILVLQLNCPGNFWGHCEKCQSLGLWLQGNLINRFEEEPGNLHIILVQRALIHFKKILYLFLP